MKEFLAAGFVFLALTFRVPAQPGPGQGWRYTLLNGSYFVDDCLICGRPTLFRPISGGFDLVFIDNAKSIRRFGVTNLLFSTREDPVIAIRGSGSLEIEDSPSLSHKVVLNLDIDGQQKTFTNDVLSLTRLLPMLATHAIQTDPNLVQFFSLDIAAAPLREVWFTTAASFISTNNQIELEPGDLLSNVGQLLKSSGESIGKFGFQPGTRSALQATTLAPGAEILFSLPEDLFSETQSRIFRRGDILSNRGELIITNELLTSNFQPQPAANFGLDALHVAFDGSLFFSVTTNFVSARIGEISSGDILIFRATPEGPTNTLHRTSQQLIANFNPLPPETNPGVDALYVWPSGEIWFSTEREFNTQTFGPVSDGDLVSDQGYVVFRNKDLVLAFEPSTGATNVGLTGLYIISDAFPSSPPPSLTISSPGRDTIALTWMGQGRAFQVEAASSPAGTFSPIIPIEPRLSSLNSISLTNSGTFFRVRQW